MENSGDIIYHKTRTVFGFWDRIKILFGGECIIESQIETKQEATIIKSSAQERISSRLFDWRISNIVSSKNKRVMHISSIDHADLH